PRSAPNTPRRARLRTGRAPGIPPPGPRSGALARDDRICNPQKPTACQSDRRELGADRAGRPDAKFSGAWQRRLTLATLPNVMTRSVTHEMSTVPAQPAFQGAPLHSAMQQGSDRLDDARLKCVRQALQRSWLVRQVMQSLEDVAVRLLLRRALRGRCWDLLDLRGDPAVFVLRAPDRQVFPMPLDH